MDGAFQKISDITGNLCRCDIVLKSIWRIRSETNINDNTSAHRYPHTTEPSSPTACGNRKI